MAKEFFQEFGEAFTKTMRDIGERAESFYSEQKLRNKISGEEKQIRKIMEELGKIIYRRYKDDVPLEDMQRRLCEQIEQRMDRISQYKEAIAGVKEKKVCPSCGITVEAGMAFCPHCGAACTTKEQEEQAGAVVAEMTAEQLEPEAAEEVLSEKMEPAAEETLSEALETEEEVPSEKPEPVEEVSSEESETAKEETEEDGSAAEGKETE
nr:zinc-ribbon domain-containing protein [uncultured Blautia sp.]